MSKPTYRGPPDRLEQYDALVARFDDLGRKGAANPYTSVNGWMTSFLDAQGSLSMRLSPDGLAEFAATYSAPTPVQYGKAMLDFIVVPDDLLSDLEALQPWFERSLAWVGTLKPKKTTR